ncbi:MAG: diguanylate cyclase [Coriobacteriia bacterium]|nr:diguanylate cyclase [Coriobacteriia bacterium]
MHKNKCMQCWACIRHCPARAIRIIDNHTEILAEKCVKCGQCITECTQQGYQIRSGLPEVRGLLQGERPVVALLAGEYIAALHPMTSEEIEARLLKVGFSSVEVTTLGEELVAVQYEELLSGPSPEGGWLRSTCPVAVDWVRLYYPDLTGNLAPFIPPYIAQARLIGALYPAGTAIVYVSPCWARKDEAFTAGLNGSIDAVIDFGELRHLLEGAASPERLESKLVAQPGAVKQFSATDGFPRRALTERDLTAGDIIVARGLDDIDQLLAAISRKEISPTLVDMLNCEGCIDGPCVNPQLSVFVKRGLDAAERRRQPPPLVNGRTLLDAMPKVALARKFEPQLIKDHNPTPAEIDEILAAGEFSGMESMLNCGACGFNTCRNHAVAIWRGVSRWDMCFPRQRRLFARDYAALTEAALVDALTGLMNRRGFDCRLAEEVSRANRYEMPLSLMMLDLDGFKAVNDEHGHPTGDMLLSAVGELLDSELRTTDIPSRYGGDEFAIILPATTKTDAWAVAEKVRLALAHLCVHTDAGHSLRTTASIGVAAVNERVWHPNDLVETADRALYLAKRAGCDRVELSSG